MLLLLLLLVVLLLLMMMLLLMVHTVGRGHGRRRHRLLLMIVHILLHVVAAAVAVGVTAAVNGGSAAAVAQAGIGLLAIVQLLAGVLLRRLPVGVEHRRGSRQLVVGRRHRRRHLMKATARIGGNLVEAVLEDLDRGGQGVLGSLLFYLWRNSSWLIRVMELPLLSFIKIHTHTHIQ